MGSKQISFGVGIPMIAVGALIALLWAPAEIELGSTVEFVGSLIGILGVVFLISGIFYTKQRVIPEYHISNA